MEVEYEGDPSFLKDGLEDLLSKMAELSTRLVFKEEENPQAKVMASARNDRLFTDGSDLVQLSKEIRYVLEGSEDVAKNFRVIAMPKTWLNDPWGSLEDNEKPENWDDRLPILILPETRDRLNERLGLWPGESHM